MFRVLIFLLLCGNLYSQTKYTRADSLKGTYGPARDWWNVLHYDLHVRFNVQDSSVSGYNLITYQVLKPGTELQLDLMQPLLLDSVVQDGKRCPVRHEGNAHFIRLSANQKGIKKIAAYYHGRPVIAKNAPWDGGVIWARDERGSPWISVACQGMAAQAWFPNKDHMKDEPDSATMHFTVPEGLFCVSNGRFVGVNPSDQEATFTWKVKNPINNYNIIPYIGRYIVLRDTLNGERGILDLEFWVLPEHLKSAQTQFAQVKPMLRCFEHWFGPYPFYEDGYKLVEAPYLGMEHQSGIAYGNGFVNGYSGRDLSGTGWGMNWDFIIVHESGHEWFGNNISAADVADNWIHEGFTAYSENLYTEWLFGKSAGGEYVRGTRAEVKNDKPVIADYGVNAGGSLDVYYKASNTLHMIRRIVNNDSLWRSALRAMNQRFRHKTVTSSDIESFLSSHLGIDLQPLFDQYLRTIQIPVLEVKESGKKLKYRFVNCNKKFSMPVDLVESGNTRRVTASTKWKKLKSEAEEITVHPDYFITLHKVK